ncbi:hypothetical protein HMPREF2626_01505 [Aerococcus sp. HMSC062A02]|uniref:helix-turn-helix domain-containing protein n=1 Tax=Aerococcus sp. HMSC062A02 TaxID=1715105 RepID=UPI0008A2CDF1|nr:helix-turn-helix transcriptional regulator [Aerococcus sp. HMSC062A02]OFN02614.1 hypothetical protein HMPREF2626_01505 [Aerococcus sp. HMSC062A02]
MGRELGQKIKSVRESKGWTQQQLGEILGNPPVKPGIISRWENGISLPNNKRLKAIADLAGTTVDDLLEEEYCEWSKSARRLSWASMYATDCGEVWIDDSTKSIEEFNYCLYCGKKIERMSDDEM